MEIAKIPAANDSPSFVAQTIDRLEGAQVVAELAFGVAQLTGGRVLCEFERLLQGQRVALDLETGERLRDLGAAPHLREPFRPQPNRVEEPRRLFDRLELTEHARRDAELGLERHALCIGSSRSGRSRKTQKLPIDFARY